MLLKRNTGAAAVLLAALPAAGQAPTGQELVRQCRREQACRPIRFLFVPYRP